MSEHDSVGEEAHRPVRRRHHGPGESEPQQSSLQLVETQPDAPVAPPTLDEEPQRRSKPRRRRAASAPNEPLKLVETRPGAEGAHPDGQS